MKKHFFFFLLSVLALASCRQDLLPNGILEQDRPLDVYIETPGLDGGGSTKASSDLLSEAYYKVNNVCFFEYDQEGKLIKHGFSYGKSIVGLVFPSDGQSVDIFLMANVGDIMQDAQTAACLQNETGIRNYVYSVDSYNTFETEGFPCAGEYLGVTRDDIPCMSVKHLVGIYRFRYKKANGVDNDITGLTMRQMASNIKPFGTLAADEVIPQMNSQRLTEQQIDILQASATDDSKYVDLYFFENLQGKTQNSDPATRGDEVGRTTQRNATIIDIKTTHETRSIYLGQNNTNDYNILRSHMSNLTFLDVYIEDPVLSHNLVWHNFDPFEVGDVTIECNTAENALYFYFIDDFAVNELWFDIEDGCDVPDLTMIEFESNNNHSQVYAEDEDMDLFRRIMISSDDISVDDDFELTYKGESLGAFIKFRKKATEPTALVDPVTSVHFEFNSAAIEPIKAFIKRVDDEHGIGNLKFDINVEMAFRYTDSRTGKNHEMKVPFTILVDRYGYYDNIAVKDFNIAYDPIREEDYLDGRWYLSNINIGSNLHSYGEYDIYIDEIISHFCEIECWEDGAANSFGIEWTFNRYWHGADLDVEYLLIGANRHRSVYETLYLYMY